MSWCGREIRWLETVDSTNDEAIRWIEEGAVHGSLVVSEEQTAGHGRGDRSWYSPAGDNIYMTLILRPRIPTDKISMITLLMGLAVSGGMDRFIKEETTCNLLESRIKWPNDVLLNGKKVCGILTGMRMDAAGKGSVYIGVGINVNGEAYPKEIKEKAVSLRAALIAVSGEKRAFSKEDRQKLISAVLQEFEELYDRFAVKQKVSFIKSEYNKRLINMGEVIKVLDPREAYEGICCGITDHGELMVETSEGLRLVMSGEISVRASDGSYV